MLIIGAFSGKVDITIRTSQSLLLLAMISLHMTLTAFPIQETFWTFRTTVRHTWFFTSPVFLFSIHCWEILTTRSARHLVILMLSSNMSQKTCCCNVAAATYVANVAQKMRYSMPVKVKQRRKVLCTNCAIVQIIFEYIWHYSQFGVKIYILLVDVS